MGRRAPTPLQRAGTAFEPCGHVGAVEFGPSSSVRHIRDVASTRPVSAPAREPREPRVPWITSVPDLRAGSEVE
jgi:hypothetical protein